MSIWQPVPALPLNVSSNRPMKLSRRSKEICDALDAAGSMIPAALALKDNAYTCPTCGNGVYVYDFPDKSIFLHREYIETCQYTNLVIKESQAHKQAKTILADCINSGIIFRISRQCRSCEAITIQTFNPTTRNVRAVLEIKLSGGYSADVAIIEPDGNIAALIEIFKTHEATKYKRMAYNSVPWAEVSADSVLDAIQRTKNFTLTPTRDHFNGFTCHGCGRLNSRRFYGGW